VFFSRSTIKDETSQVALAFETSACKRINRYHNCHLSPNKHNVLIDETSLKMKTFKSQAISASIASSILGSTGRRNLTKNYGMLLFCFPIKFKTATKSTKLLERRFPM